MLHDVDSELVYDLVLGQRKPTSKAFFAERPLIGLQGVPQGWRDAQYVMGG